MSPSTCLQCCQLWECHRDEKRVSSRQTFSLLCWLALAEIMSVDPAVGFTVIAKVLCHSVLPLNPGLAILCAMVPTGLNVCVKKAKADKPGETFQEATCLFFYFSSSLQDPCRESFLRLAFLIALYIPGGSAAVPAGALCHFPPWTARLQLGAAGACCAIIPCCFHSTAVGARQLGPQTALPPPVAAVASSMFKYCSYRFMSSHALFEVIRSHTRLRASWETSVCISKNNPYGKKKFTLESPEVLA